MSVALLIDCRKYIKKDLHPKLIEKCKDFPKTKAKIGLILIIPYSLQEKLNSIDNKIEFINTEEFVSSIQSFNYIIYNHRKKICEILNPSASNINLVLPCILENFGDKTIVLVSIPFKNRKTDISVFLSLHFGKPYICNKSISSNLEFSERTICLIYDGSKSSSTMDELNYLMSNERTDNYCMLKAKFSKRTQKFFEQLWKTGGIKNGQQHEVAGNMSAKLVGDTHVMEYNEDTVKRGKETGVDIIDGAFNYHSHPEQAYEKYKVKYAWPSKQDYIGFLYAIIEDDTIFHVVVTREGIYLLSLSYDWAVNKDQLTKGKTGDYIDNNYVKSLHDEGTPEDYIEWTKNKSYKGKGPLFMVQYRPWNEVDSLFVLPYTKIGDNCFTCQKSKELFKKYYNIK